MKLFARRTVFMILGLLFITVSFSANAENMVSHLFCLAKIKRDPFNKSNSRLEINLKKGSGIWEPDFSEDGKRLYFNNLPFGNKTDLYLLIKNGQDWSFAPRLVRLDTVNNSKYSDRGISVISDEHGCDHIYFIAMRKRTSGRVYEARQIWRSDEGCVNEDGAPVFRKPQLVPGNINDASIISIDVFPDKKTMVLSGPGVFNARLTLAKKEIQPDGSYEWNITNSQAFRKINEYADKNKTHGIIDPYIGPDGRNLFFVISGNIYSAQWNKEEGLFDNTVQLDAIDIELKKKYGQSKPWTEGPTSTVVNNEHLLVFHQASFWGGRIWGCAIKDFK